MNFKDRSILIKLFTPVVIIAAGVVIFIYFFISNEIEKNIINQSIKSAETTVDQYKVLRKYYASNVIPVVKNKSNIQIDINHKNNDNMIPLPATMIHELGALIGNKKDGIKLKLYSDYPFPNRKNRQLDAFSNNAMMQFRNGNTNPFTSVETFENKKVVRVAIADFMVAKGCVSCHNTRADTPKNDWKMGDVRGSLEVIIPIEDQLIAMKYLNYKIMLLLLFLGIVLFTANKFPTAV